MPSRSRSPSARRRATLAVALGLVLVLNPLYFGFPGIGEPAYRYRAVEVAPTDSGLRFETRPPSEITGVRDVDCFAFDSATPIECAFQTEFTDGENYTALLEGAPRGGWENYVRLNGSFYRRYYRGERVNGDDRRDDERGKTRVTAWLRPVSSEDVLSDVSARTDSLSGVYRQVVERGRLRTDEPLPHDRSWGEASEGPTGRLVGTDDGYYLVGLDSYDPPLEHRRFYSAVGVLLGVIGLGYGYRTSLLAHREDAN